MFEEDSREQLWTVEDYRNALENRNIQIEELRQDVAAQVRRTNWLVGQERARREAAEAKADYLECRLRAWSVMPAYGYGAIDAELNYAQRVDWRWSLGSAFAYGRLAEAGKSKECGLPKVENYAQDAQISTRVRVARLVALPISAALRTLDFIKTAPPYVQSLARKFWLTSIAPEILRMTGRWPGKARPEEMPIETYRAWREAGGYR